jgi:hypothetical protein
LVRPPQLNTLAGAPETIAANDNRRSAGTLKDGVLTVRLEARSGTWYPEGEHGVGVETAAWAEVDDRSRIRASHSRLRRDRRSRNIHNALAKPLTVYGFASARGVKDSIVIAPAQRATPHSPHRRRDVLLRRTDSAGPIQARIDEDSQLNGAIVVVPGRQAVDRARVSHLVVVHSRFDEPQRSGRGTMAINGLSWPHTEKLDLVQMTPCTGA